MLKAAFFLSDQQLFEPDGLIAEPIVSVILPTYRRGDSGQLARAAHSVLTQTLRELELIIVDDGSTDSTRETAERLVRIDPRVRYVRHDRNSGLPALRVNEGLTLARGRYVAYQFDDDYWEPDALEVLHLASEEAAEPSVVHGRCLFREDGREQLLGLPITPRLLRLQNRIANNAVMHPRDFPELYGGYDMHVAMRRLCDWDLWLRWSDRAPFVFLDRVVSVVDARQPGSIAATVPPDLPLFRAISGLTRDDRLRLPGAFEQIVDAPLDAELFTPAIRASAKRQVAEWLSRRWDVQGAAGSPGDDVVPATLVLGDAETPLDAGLRAYAAASGAPVQRLQLAELAEERQADGSAVIFTAPVTPEVAERMLELAESPAAVLLAGDPSVGEGSGEPEALTAADLVLCTNSDQAEAARRWNPRVVVGPGEPDAAFLQAVLAAGVFHRIARGARGAEGRPAAALLIGPAANATERRAMRDAAQTLVRFGVRPVLVSTEPDAETLVGVEAVTLTPEQMADPAAVAREVERCGASLLHMVGAHGPGEKAGRLARVPVAVSAGLDPPPEPEVDVVDADLVFSRSRAAASAWIERVGTPARRLPDIASSVASPLSDESDRRVGVPGPVFAGSGHLEAVQALASLGDVGITLIIPSEGDAPALAACLAEVSRSSLGGAVVFDDRAPATAVLFPSADPDPAAVLAEMAAGRLVIGSSLGAAGELMSEATGVLLDGQHVAAVARSLARYAGLSATEKAARRALAAAVARREGSLDSLAAALLAGYAELLAIGEQHRRAALDAVARTVLPPLPSDSVRSLDDLYKRLSDRVGAEKLGLADRYQQIQRQTAVLTRIPESVADLKTRVAEAGETAAGLRTQLLDRLEGIAAEQTYAEGALAVFAKDRITSERALFRPLALANLWNARRRDLTGAVQASWFSDWLDDPVNRRTGRDRIQLERFWTAGESETFDLPGGTEGLFGVDLGVWLFLPPPAPTPLLTFTILAADGSTLREGLCEAGPLTGQEAARLRFLPLAGGEVAARLRLTALPEVERIGLKLYEIRHVQPLTHRASRRRLLHRSYRLG